MADINKAAAAYTEAAHLEDAPEKRNLAEVDDMLLDEERAPEARGTTTEAIPRSYWYSARFLGTMAAIIVAKDAGSAGFSLAAPALATINRELGPDPDVIWVSLAWTITQSISMLLVGRISDLFGRRWIFILTNLVGLVGSIFASLVQTVPQLIGATVLLGVAGGSQISYFWIISEIVPMRFRFAANALVYFCSVTTYLGPKISYSLTTEYETGWRGCYWLLIGLNAVSTVLFYIFYHPPTFKMLHRKSAVSQLLKNFDWVGLVLYVAGLTVFLMGLTWGGGRYPWDSSYVIGTLVAGAIGLIVFGIWETYMPQYLKNMIPLVEVYHFTNLPYIMAALLTSIGACAFYGYNSVWPGLVTTVYTGLSDYAVGDVLCVAIICYMLGSFLGGIGHWVGARKPTIISMMVAGPILACAAIDPFNMALTASVLGIGTFFLGLMEMIAITATTFPLRSQKELGSAGGLAGSVRLFISTIATCVYNTTLRNRLNTTIPSKVGSAATQAGLAQSQVPMLIEALRAGSTLNSTTVPGINPTIAAAARLGWRHAYSQAYQTMFFVTIVFIVPGMVMCWFIADNDAKKNEFIAGHIHNPREEKELEQQDG